MTWHKTSRHARGYGTAWDKLRLFILERDHWLCQCPNCQGGKLRITPATQVDHIKAKADGGTDDPANLRAVSAACHRRITDAHMGRTTRPRVQVGADGYPMTTGGRARP